MSFFSVLMDERSLEKQCLDLENGVLLHYQVYCYNLKTYENLSFFSSGSICLSSERFSKSNMTGII